MASRMLQGGGSTERRRRLRRPDEKPELAGKQSLEEVLSRPVGTLFSGSVNQTRSAVRALEAAGIETIGDALAVFPLERLLKAKGIGPATVGKLKEGLDSLGVKRAHEPRIMLSESGRLETNLSYEQLRTLIRVAKLELEELREDLQPHRVKAVGELLDMIEAPERKGGR